MGPAFLFPPLPAPPPPPHLPSLSSAPAHTASLCTLLSCTEPGPVSVPWASPGTGTACPGVLGLLSPLGLQGRPSLAEGPEPRLARLGTQSPRRSSGHFPEPSEAAAQRPAPLLSQLPPEEAVRAPRLACGAQQESDTHPLTQLMIKLSSIWKLRSAIALCQQDAPPLSSWDAEGQRDGKLAEEEEWEVSDPESVSRGNQSKARGFLRERCPLGSHWQPRRLPSSLSGAPVSSVAPPPSLLSHGFLSHLRAHSQGVGTPRLCDLTCQSVSWGPKFPGDQLLVWLGWGPLACGRAGRVPWKGQLPLTGCNWGWSLRRA